MPLEAWGPQEAKSKARKDPESLGTGPGLMRCFPALLRFVANYGIRRGGCGFVRVRISAMNSHFRILGEIGRGDFLLANHRGKG